MSKKLKKDFNKVPNNDDKQKFLTAAKDGDKAVVSEFLEKYGSSLFDVRGYTSASGALTALGMAARFGQLEVIELLLEKGWPINERSQGGRTPLFTADPDAIKLLVKKGMDINAQDRNGWTALMLEAINGDLDRVKLFVDLGAALDITCNEGRTAESWARGDGDFHVADFLKKEEAKKVSSKRNISSSDHLKKPRP